MSLILQVLWSNGIIAAETPYDSPGEDNAALKAVRETVESAFTEGDSIRVITSDGEVFFKERYLDKLKKRGFSGHNWPMVPSPTFKGENTISCPRCGSTSWTLGGHYAAHGTAPGGRGRLGDPGGSEVCRCNDCHFETWKESKR